MTETMENDKIISCDRALDFGTIEKLCPKYGFIKCLGKNSKDKRLFFHSSATLLEYNELSIGDCVTYERTMANGKPLATNVQRTFGDLIEGSIVKMPRRDERGSISYEVNGESFFVAFEKDDVVEEGRLRAKDEVTFEKVDRTGIAFASRVRRRYNKPIRVQGVVTAVKDKFGFIDRSDVVKEIYFNLSASPPGVDVVPGTELEFSVKHLRNGKEEAVNIRVLKPGSVQFANVIDTTLYGTLLRSPDSRRASSGDVLAGNISYVCSGDGKVLQIPFGERDRKYSYSLHPGDIVSFKVAVDLRDQLQRACQVELCLDSFPSRKETRHLGVVKMFDGTAGLIEPDLPPASNKTEDMLVAFKAKEWLVPTSKDPLSKFMAVSYTPLQVTRSTTGTGSSVSTTPKITTHALRIAPAEAGKMNHLRLYPAGSLRGVIQSPAYDQNDLGIIVCQFGGAEKRSVAFTTEDLLVDHVNSGEEVEFGCLDRTNKQYLPPAAFNIRPVSRPHHHQHASGSVSHTGSSARRVCLLSNGRAAGRDSRKQRSHTLPEERLLCASFNGVLMEDGDNNLQLDEDEFIDQDEYEVEMHHVEMRKPRFGWVVILKEHFGFIESANHRYLFKFNPHATSGDLQIDSRVQFYRRMGARGYEADSVLVVDDLEDDELDSGDEEDEDAAWKLGEIVRPLCLSEGAIYPGTLRDLSTSTQSSALLGYSMKSLLSFRSKLANRDRIIFRPDPASGWSRARLVVPLRQTARVASLSKDGSALLRCCVLDERRLRFSGSNSKRGSMHGVNLKLEFELDVEAVQRLSEMPLTVDDQVDLTLDLRPDDAANPLFVVAVKPHKTSTLLSQQPYLSALATDHSGQPCPRRVYRIVPSDEPRILHLRAPRLPLADNSAGFTVDLKRLPDLVPSPVAPS